MLQQAGQSDRRVILPHQSTSSQHPKKAVHTNSTVPIHSSSFLFLIFLHLALGISLIDATLYRCSDK